MKRSILISVLSFLALFAISQSLIQENKSWSVVRTMNFAGSTTETFKIWGDTIIDQIEYKKLYRSNDSTYSNWYKNGALRENENRVYFYNYYDNTEKLLYDFNLSIGEIFVYVHVVDTIEMELASIDTVILQNGEERQRFNFSNNESWITGIGSDIGLVNVGMNEYMIDLWYVLNCCHENEELLFQSEMYDDCYINTLAISDHALKDQYTIYPNPFAESASFEFQYINSHNYKLHIIISTGQIVKSFDQINSGTIHISGNNLNSGIYFYQLIKDDKEIISGKLIKN